MTRRFNALTRAAGLRPVRLHDLRHGAASLIQAADVPMAMVSKMLRHPSIGITVDTYHHLSDHHLSDDSARAASDAMGQLLDQAFDRAASAARDHPATTTGDALPATGASAGETTGQQGGPRGDRTLNPRIKSPLLCQLS